MSMGGGGSGNTTTTQKFEPPENTKEGWNTYMQNATNLMGQPYQSSGIPTVAPFNDFQQTSQNMLYDRALSGAPDLNAGRAAVTGIASGNQANPWQAFLAGTASGANSNPFLANAQSMANGKANPYMVDPQAVIDATAADMTKAAQKGTMAQTDAAFNRAGAYGGSAYTEAQAANSAELANSIGSMSAQARLAANQQNANTWGQDQQRALQATGMGGGMFDSGMGRQIQAAMGGGQMFGNDINNMLSAAGLSGQLSQDDWQSIGQLMNGGNIYGQYEQALLNAGNQEFQNQFMYPYTQNEMFGGALTRASGQGGSSSASQQAPGYNPYWNAAGLGLAGYGLLNSP